MKIKHQLRGNVASVAHSESDISVDASLEVYERYNPTDLSLKAKEKETGSGGMTFVARKQGGEMSEWIDVKIEANKQQKIADHASEIVNSFEHENQHYKDYQSVGFNAFAKTSLDTREQRAVHSQMNHKSFSRTRSGFQAGVKSYGETYNMAFPLAHRPAVFPIPVGR